ncbi:MAG: hypothetical protein H8E55_57085 [Pelagibacterales bacterium]|nr:hypothetical protein [Pelagibacterales bacterium]
MNKLTEELIKPFLNEVGKDKKIKTIVGIYPGRFQPAGRHHAKTFKWLQKKFGKNTFIATSNKQEPSKSPLNFKEKQMVWKKHGVPSSKVVQVKNPYLAVEVLKKYDPETTAVVFIFGAKDVGRLTGGKKASGGARYFQPLKNIKDVKGYEEHGYFLVAPHVSIKVGGKEISGTMMRNSLGTHKLDVNTKKGLFKEIFGWYDDKLFNLLSKRFEKSVKEISESLPTKVKDKYKKVKPGDPKDKKKFKQFIDHHKYHSGPHIDGLESEPETYDFDDSDESKPGVQKRKKDKKKKGYEPVTENWLEKGSKKDRALKLKISKLYSKAFKLMSNSPAQLKVRKEIEKLRNQLSEGVDLPIEIGDTVLMGKFKNKKVVIKTIGWNEKGDLLINGKSAMRMRIPKKPNVFDETIEEFLTTIDMNDIIKEATTTALSGLQAVDSGPNALMGGMGGYAGRNKEQAEQIGWEVINYMLGVDISQIPPNKKEFKNSRVSSVTYLPAGIGTGITPNNQDNLTGVQGYNKWVKNMKKVAQEVGFKLIKFKDEKDIKKQISKDTKATLKQQKSDEKDIKDVKVEESVFSQDWWKTQLITEGGAYGHMAHPFDDKDLTFGDLKKIIELGLGGQLNREDNVTEKLDGQNLMISWKNDKLIVARNKGHLKNFGQNALDVKGTKAKFKGRGDISDAFGFAVTDLQKAIKGLSQKQKDKIFNEGQHWMNLEVMWPASANMIDYDVATIIFHGALKYDDSGKVIGEVKGSASILRGMIKQINAHIQKKYSIGKPNFLDVPKHQDFGKLKPKFLARLNKLRNEFGLKDSDTLSMYHQSFWEEFIYNGAKQFNYKLPNSVLVGLTKRWAFFDKSYKVSAIKKEITNDEFLEWVLAFDKQDHSRWVKQNMKAFETLFFEVGAEILKNVKGYIAVNPDKAAKGIKNRLTKAISDVRKGGDLKKLNSLKVQMDRLNAIGGFDAIVPSEGIVFKYKGNIYKFTGAFAPINQITGLVTF